MKITKKICISLAAGILAATSISVLANNSEQAQAVENIDQRSLVLNHKTRVYNKKGQKKYSYLKSNGLLKKGSTVQYASKIKSVANVTTKRYSFHDDDWNWFYLPYKTIKGKEYYSIGHGGYIKAINVDKINGNDLYTNEVTVTAQIWMINKTVPLYDNHGKLPQKYSLKNGKKVVVDQMAAVDDFGRDLQTPPVVRNLYRIKGTSEFICDNTIKSPVRQKLPLYSVYTQACFVKSAPYYDENAKVEKRSSQKGEMVRLSKAVKIINANTHKEELFYEVIGGKGHFVKATDVKYLTGPLLPKIDN